MMTSNVSFLRSSKACDPLAASETACPSFSRMSAVDIRIIISSSTSNNLSFRVDEPLGSVAAPLSPFGDGGSLRQIKEAPLFPLLHEPHEPATGKFKKTALRDQFTPA